MSPQAIKDDFDDWVVLPVWESRMERYNPTALYKVGTMIGELRTIAPGATGNDVMMTLIDARMRSQKFWELTSPTFSEGCKRAARGVYEAVCSVMLRTAAPGVPVPPDQPLTDNERERLRQTAAYFETIFLADCVALSLFNVPRVLAYDTLILIESGEQVIPVSLQAHLTDAIKKDIQESTRAIAFDLPTACAFHIARATEGTMREYHVKSIGPLPPCYQQQTFGSLVKEFENQGLNSGLVGNLKHIKDHYRNPISHPDELVSIEQSHKLLGVYVAAIVDMLDCIERGTP